MLFYMMLYNFSNRHGSIVLDRKAIKGKNHVDNWAQEVGRHSIETKDRQEHGPRSPEHQGD